MAKTPYFYRRNNINYFRFVVPVELRETLKVREIIKSLKTQNRKVAIPLALQLAANVTSAFYDLKSRNISTSELMTQLPLKQLFHIFQPDQTITEQSHYAYFLCLKETCKFITSWMKASNWLHIATFVKSGYTADSFL